VLVHVLEMLPCRKHEVGSSSEAIGRQGIHLAGYTAQTLEQEQDHSEAGHVLIHLRNIIWNAPYGRIEHEQEHEHERTSHFASGHRRNPASRARSGQKRIEAQAAVADAMAPRMLW